MHDLLSQNKLYFYRILRHKLLIEIVSVNIIFNFLQNLTEINQNNFIVVYKVKKVVFINVKDWNVR